MQKKILIVGQGPSKDGVGQKPLNGPGSGEALAELAHVTLERMHELADAVNLFDEWYGKSGKGDSFPAKLAKKKADEIKPMFAQYQSVLLLGTNVAKAFGVYPVDMLVWQNMTPPFLAVVPHPSGVNHWYNDGRNRADASAFLRSLFSDRMVPQDVVLLDKSETAKIKRAEYCTNYLREFDRKLCWVDLGAILVEVERDELYLKVGSKTWDDWARFNAPGSYRLCYIVKRRFKALKDRFTADELRKMPAETADWASWARNISPAALDKPEVRAALTLPKKKAIEVLKEAAPEEHIEHTHNFLCKFQASQYNSVSDAHEAYRALKDEKASMEDFIEFLVAEWMDSMHEFEQTIREAWQQHRGVGHEGTDPAPAVGGQNIAAV